MVRLFLTVLFVGFSGSVLAELPDAPGAPGADNASPIINSLPRPAESSIETAIPASVRMLNELKSLRLEMQALRNEVEQQGHDMEGLKRRQRDMYLDIDRRLAQRNSPDMAGSSDSVENIGSTVTPNSTVSEAQTLTPRVSGEAAVVEASVEDEKLEQKRYSSAFQLVKDGHYDEAVVSFRSFLQDYPNSKYSDNAQYWIAECFYVGQKYALAATEFNKVLVDYPKSSKVSGALLKIGIIHLEQGENQKAKEILNSVVDKYPNTTVSQLALNRLKKLATAPQ